KGDPRCRGLRREREAEPFSDERTLSGRPSDGITYGRAGDGMEICPVGSENYLTAGGRRKRFHRGTGRTRQHSVARDADRTAVPEIEVPYWEWQLKECGA